MAHANPLKRVFGMNCPVTSNNSRPIDDVFKNPISAKHLTKLRPLKDKKKYKHIEENVLRDQKQA